MTISPALIIALIVCTMLYGIGIARYQTRRNSTDSEQEPLDGHLPQSDSSHFPRRRIASDMNCSSARNRINDRVTRLLAVLAIASLTIAVASRYVAGG